MQRLLPEHRLKPVPAEHSLFTMPNKVAQLGVTPALAAQTKSAAVKPALLGMEIDDHYAVIYSPFGMAGGWEMSQNPYAHGYDESGSVLLGQNILMYAVTQ